MCKVCNREEEGILHLFFKCVRLKFFIKKLKEMVEKFGGEETIVDVNWETMFLLVLKMKPKMFVF